MDKFSTLGVADCPECQSQVLLVDLLDVEIHGGAVYADELGYVGDCPVCQTEIFVENID